MTTNEWRDARTPAGLIAFEELARLLVVWASRKFVATSRVALSRWARDAAASGPRIPDPNPALTLMLRLRLAEESTAGRVQPDPFLTTAAYVAPRHDRFDPRVAFAVLERMLGVAEFSRELHPVLEHLRLESGLPMVRWTSVRWHAKRFPAWIWLQQLGLGEHVDDRFVADERLIPFLLDIRLGRGVLSPQELERRLQLQRERSARAEELVLRLERERLLRAGLDELAEDVERVSLTDVGAGFDIRSYDPNGATRYIEVKSSSGPRERFFISPNEVAKAEAEGAQYWLAWVGWTSRLPAGPCEVAWFRDPAKLLRASGGPWAVAPHHLTVTRVSSDLDAQADPTSLRSLRR